jgi:hypothetical protein
LGRTFGVWDIERTVFLGSLEDIDHDWLWAAWYGWLVMVPVAVAGAVVLRRRGGELWPLMAPVVMVVVVTVTTYGNLRFRVAAEPSAAVLSAYAVVAAWRRWNERRASSSAHEHAPGGSL